MFPIPKLYSHSEASQLDYSADMHRVMTILEIFIQGG